MLLLLCLTRISSCSLVSLENVCVSVAFKKSVVCCEERDLRKYVVLI